MKFTKILVLFLAAMVLVGCGLVQTEQTVDISLSDNGITVDGSEATGDNNAAVYVAHDIVYYEADKGITYGEGTEADAHSAQEAQAHTVVHITKPGTYRLSGKLSQGQIAIDLGENGEDDPNAVVTLILNGVDITCSVAPAVIFYNVYECGDKDDPKKDVDTTRAGANVIIADGTQNHVCGSYVARIYKPETVELNQEGTEVKDAKKLHKYDAAFYSKMSMNISGGGTLNIVAENEGLDSELHLTINGGDINILSGNDGINTNEDGVSVTTINGGSVNIQVTGQTGEGDGIDSNGWLVINGGQVIAAACSTSMDSGIDSDMGIHINGGTVIATGSMLDRIQNGGQTYAVFTVSSRQKGDETVTLKDEQGNAVMAHCPQNDWAVLIYSSPALKPGTYTLWLGERQVSASANGTMGGSKGFGGGMPPEGFDPGAGNFTMPEGGQPPEGFGDGRPEDRQPSKEQGPGGEMPQGGGRPDGGKPDGNGNFGRPGDFGGRIDGENQSSSRLEIQEGANQFQVMLPQE